jgi:hypothetical protein
MPGLVEVQVDRGCMTERAAIQQSSLRVVRDTMVQPSVGQGRIVDGTYIVGLHYAWTGHLLLRQNAAPRSTLVEQISPCRKRGARRRRTHLMKASLAIARFRNATSHGFGMASLNYSSVVNASGNKDGLPSRIARKRYARIL